MANIIFIYDVQLNWADGLLKSYFIPQYHEWYKDDELDKFTCMPVVKVSEELFTYIEQEYDKLPRELLNAVFSKASKKIDGMAQPIKYAFVVTDGKHVLAVDTNDGEEPNLKSYLSPRNTEDIEDNLHKLELLKTNFVIPEPLKLAKKDQLMSDMLLLDEEAVKGLTRAEKDLKNILFTHLYALSTSNNKEEVRYWYSEVFPGTFHNEKVKKMRISTMIQKMFDELKVGWDERHIRLGSQFVKANEIFKATWIDRIKRQEREKDKVSK